MQLKLIEDKSCTVCELHEGINSVCVPTVHYPESLPQSGDSPLIIFIGQNPGFNEDQKNEPFIGRSGDVVKQAYIGGSNLQSLASIYLTNGVRCHTQANEMPKPKHYKACVWALEHDLRELFNLHADQMKIVVTLGAPATSGFYKEVLGLKKISLSKSFTQNGECHDHPVTGMEFFLFSTYHPAAVLRNNNHINAVDSHMQLVSDCLMGTMAEPSDPIIVPSRSPRRNTDVPRNN